MVAACRMLGVILLTFGLFQVLPSGSDGDRSWSSTSEDSLSSPSYVGDVARVLNAWLPAGGTVAYWALREPRTRSAAPPAHVDGDGKAVFLVALGVVLVLCSPRHSAVGLRWARALRGPPSLSLAP